MNKNKNSVLEMDVLDLETTQLNDNSMLEMAALDSKSIHQKRNYPTNDTIHVPNAAIHNINS